jgi:hypothetical protein
MLALPLALAVIMLSIGEHGRLSILVSTILCFGVVFTHGGLALELIFILAAISLMTRKRAAIQSVIVSSFIFASYVAFAVATNTYSGIVTIIQFAQAILSPITLQISYSLTSVSELASPGAILQIMQVWTVTFWFVFLGLVSWIGFLLVMLEGKANNRRYYTFSILGLGLFGIGVLLLLLPVAENQAFRYISLISYPMISIPAAAGIISVESRRASRRKVLSALVTLLIVSSILSVTVSPFFWSDVGQNRYAGFRLVHTETYQELEEQTYLNAYDNCFPVVSNYYPNFVNLVPGPGACSRIASYRIIGETTLNGEGVVSNTKLSTNGEGFPLLSPPYVILFSARLQPFDPVSYHFGNPQSEVSENTSSIVYSGGSTWIALVS